MVRTVVERMAKEGVSIPAAAAAPAPPPAERVVVTVRVPAA